MKKVLSIIGIAVVAAVVVLLLFLDSIIKKGIETAGPKFAGVPMSVEKVRVNPLSGRVNVKGLIIGNPEGFNTPSAMELGEFKLEMSIASLFTDTIVIKQILIDAPEITYERSLRTSNLATLINQLTPKERAAKEPQPKTAPAKKVIIDDFQLNGAKVHVTITALGGQKMTLPLPPIQMRNIGKEGGGTNIREVLSEVFTSITDAVVKAVAASGDLAGDALKGAGGAAADAVKGVGGAATDAAKGATDTIKKGIGGLFGKE